MEGLPAPCRESDGCRPLIFQIGSDLGNPKLIHNIHHIRRWWDPSSHLGSDFHKERAENIGVYIFTADSASNLARGYSREMRDQGRLSVMAELE